MAQCGVCGAQLGQSDVFCPACGSPVGAAAAPLASSQPIEQKSSNTNLIIGIVAGVGLLILAVMFFGSSAMPGGGGGGKPAVVGVVSTSTVVATQTATPTPPPVTPAPVVTPPPPAPAKPKAPTVDTSEDGKFATLVPSANYTSGGAQNIDFDYVQFYEGAAAEKEAAKHGDTADSGYYIVNDNTKIRTYELKYGTLVLIHAPSDPTHTHSFSYNQFRNLLGGDTLTYGGWDYNLHNDLYWVTIKNHKVVKLENIWFP
jgi:hypothetical protein